MTGKELRARRRALDITQEELGAIIECSAVFVCLMEQGAKKIPSEKIEKIENYFQKRLHG